MQNSRNRKESSEWLSKGGTTANNQMIVVTSRKGSASPLYVSTNFADVLWRFLASWDSAYSFETFVTDDRMWSATLETFHRLDSELFQKKVIL